MFDLLGVNSELKGFVLLGCGEKETGQLPLRKSSNGLTVSRRERTLTAGMMHHNTVVAHIPPPSLYHNLLYRCIISYRERTIYITSIIHNKSEVISKINHLTIRSISDQSINSVYRAAMQPGCDVYKNLQRMFNLGLVGYNTRREDDTHSCSVVS